MAAVAALKGSSALVAALGGQKVYSNIPEGVSAPYILLSGTSEVPWAEVFASSGDDGARECQFGFEVISNAQGLDEVESLSGLAVAALLPPEGTASPFASVARFSAATFVLADQPQPVEVNGVIYLTRPCAIKVFLS